jgi:hypothetical protein
MGSEQVKDATNSVNFQHPCAGKVTIFDHEKALVEETCPDGSPRTKVAIVGFAASSKDLAPYDDPTWSIWGLNQLYRHIPRADRWLEIHHNWNNHVVEGTDHQKWLAEAPIPVYMVDRVPTIPNSVRYPIERVMTGNPDYFTSTVAFAIALALSEGFKEIGLWGIDLIVGDEYFYQKPCAEFWIGTAHGKGVTITLPKTTALCTQSHRYGYQSEPESLIKMSELMKRKQGLLDERHKRMVELANIDGALQENQMWNELADLRSKGGTINP